MVRGENGAGSLRGGSDVYIAAASNRVATARARMLRRVGPVQVWRMAFLVAIDVQWSRLATHCVCSREKAFSASATKSDKPSTLTTLLYRDSMIPTS